MTRYTIILNGVLNLTTHGNLAVLLVAIPCSLFVAMHVRTVREIAQLEFNSLSSKAEIGVVLVCFASLLKCIAQPVVVLTPHLVISAKWWCFDKSVFRMLFFFDNQC